jgi:hypothetical protein
VKRIPVGRRGATPAAEQQFWVECHMKISRATFALLGWFALFFTPFILIMVGSLWAHMLGQTDPFMEFMGIMLKDADELASKVGFKQLLGGIFLLMFLGGTVLYLLLCIVGAILLLILRELIDLRRRIMPR